MNVSSASTLHLMKHSNDFLSTFGECRPFVSIIVVTLARDIRDLKECLSSLLAQTYDKIEILVVVDEPSREIRKLLNQSLNRYQIKVFFNDNVVGISRARNIGITEAKGDIVAFIDDDAVAFNDWVENFVKCYDCDIAAVGGRILPKNPPFHKILLALNEDPGDAEKLVDYINGCNMSFRKSVLLENLFNPSIDYGNDETELALRLVDKGYVIKYCPKAVVKHDSSKSWKNLIWKHFKFGEQSVIVSSLKKTPKNDISYNGKSFFLIRCFRETKSISVVLGVLILYMIRRVGVAKGIIKNCSLRFNRNKTKILK